MSVIGFKGELKDDTTRVEFMQSDGGLVHHRKFSGLKAILSGPAGGVVGYARTSYSPEDGMLFSGPFFESELTIGNFQARE